MKQPPTPQNRGCLSCLSFTIKIGFYATSLLLFAFLLTSSTKLPACISVPIWITGIICTLALLEKLLPKGSEKDQMSR